MRTNEVTPTNLMDLVKSINYSINKNTQFIRFQRLYHNDRIAFVHDCLPEIAKTITPYQEEILGLFDSGIRRIAVRGPHGLGKTYLASIIAHHSILTAEDDAKTITTASAWRQLEKYLWPEIRKTAKKIDWNSIGREPYTRDEFLSLAIKLNGGTIEAFAIACDDSETIEGAHATYLTYIFDEAKAIPRATWNAAEGAFSNANISNKKDIEYQYDDVIIPSIYSNNPPIENIIGSNDSPNLYRNIFETSYSKEDINKPYTEDRNSMLEYPYDMDNDIAIDSNIGGISTEKPYTEDMDVLPYTSYTGIHNNDAPNSIETRIKETGIDTNKEKTQFNPPPSMYLDKPSSNNDTYFKVSTNQLSIREGSTTYRPMYNNPDAQTYEAIAFAISTPGEPSGQFYDIHMHKQGYEDWYTRHVTIDEAIHAGRISIDWVEQRAIQWGEESSVYQNRVLGEFADVSDEGIIPLSWIRKAIERYIAWKNAGSKLPDYGIWAIGCDIARGGEDKTVLAVRKASVLQNFYTYSKLSTVTVAGYIEKAAAVDRKYIHIEIDGIGAGVYDILRADNTPNLRPITVSGGTTWRDRSKELRFANVRAAMWWNMRELLDPGNSNVVIEKYGTEIMLPPDDKMMLDLCTPRWEMKREATVALESKDSIIARLGRSPDHGTAACLAFWSSSTGGGVVF